MHRHHLRRRASMRPDVVCPADALPFQDGAFDVIACRIAAHHFPSIPRRWPRWRGSVRGRLVIEDTLFHSEGHERAEQLRDPSHVRLVNADEWEAAFAAAGLRVTDRALAPEAPRPRGVAGAVGLER